MDTTDNEIGENEIGEEPRAHVIPGNGLVARCGPLTVVTADQNISGPVLMSLLDDLNSSQTWSFEDVASALQAFVVANKPSGVAALLSDPSEPTAFVFDQAEAIVGETRLKGVGRQEWTTEFVTEPIVELRLANVPYTAPDDDTDFRAGLVRGGGITLSTTYVVLNDTNVDTITPVTTDTALSTTEEVAQAVPIIQDEPDLASETELVSTDHVQQATPTREDDQPLDLQLDQSATESPDLDAPPPPPPATESPDLDAPPPPPPGASFGSTGLESAAPPPPPPPGASFGSTGSGITAPPPPPPPATGSPNITAPPPAPNQMDGGFARLPPLTGLPPLSNQFPANQSPADALPPPLSPSLPADIPPPVPSWAQPTHNLPQSEDAPPPPPGDAPAPHGAPLPGSMPLDDMPPPPPTAGESETEDGIPPLPPPGQMPPPYPQPS